MEEVFGPFRLVAPLGRGGMADTFVGERTGLARFVQRVCVKRILAAQSREPTFIRLFQKEARVAATLQHPNIVALYDFGEVDGRWWMSLELIEGADLRALMTWHDAQGTRLPIDAVLFVAAELAKALSYAHSRRAPVVHRDVTPTNVLVSEAGAVKLADFGIAKVIAEERGRTRTGAGAGKAGYISPEEANELPIDHRADLFALGVVLFEALAGTRPYDGPTEWATKLNASAGKKKDLRSLAPETPEPLVRIVESLIESEVEARMPSADALLDALSEMPVRPNVVRTLGAMASAAKGMKVADAAEPPTAVDKDLRD